jgi:hypothetical protein
MIIVGLCTYIALWLLLLGNTVESYIERSMLLDMDRLGCVIIKVCFVLQVEVKNVDSRGGTE